MRRGTLGVGALLMGCALAGCSSDNGETPFDAGDLPDGIGGEDTSAPNSDTGTTALGTDAGDATLTSPGEDSGSSAEDAGDGAAHTGADAARDADLDASFEDVLDASQAHDARDASEVSDAASADAGEASTLCDGFSLSQDAITSIAASTSPGGVALNIVTTDPTQNLVPADDSVVVTATTSPVGVMSDISVAYSTTSAASPVYISMSLVTTTGGSQPSQTWSGSIPPIAAGEDVSFWVVGHDYCKAAADAGADFYSNSGANYHYESRALPDASAAPDASDASLDDTGSPSAPDATTGPDATTDAAPIEDASDDSPSPADAAIDAADSAVACMSCGTTVSFLGNTSAYANGSSITLTGGTVPDGLSVTAVTQTYPKGSATAHLVYATNSTFTGAADVVMTYDTNQPAPNNDQWYAIIPVQNASTTVYWYVRADGCDCATTLYDPGNFTSFTYTEQ